MRKVVLLDFGHSWLTPGKRTFFFEDGSFMHEWEFNNAVGLMVYHELLKSGFDVFITSTYKFDDISPQERTDRANKEIAKYGRENCLFISIHANASGEEWNTANGFSTFSYPGNATDLAVNKQFNKTLEPMMAKYGIRNRGVKQENFHMVREPLCPAILIEHAFMTNKREAKLLLTNEFRKDCAMSIVKGINKHFKVAEIDFEAYRSRFGFKINYMWSDIDNLTVKTFDYGKSNRQIVDKNCVNGTFFSWEGTGKYFSTSILYHNGTIYQDVANHYKEQGKPQSCFIIHNDGHVSMRRLYNVREQNLSHVKTIIGGMGLINTLDKNFKCDPKAEGFCKCVVNGKTKDYSDVLRTCPKTVVAWRKAEPNKIYLINFPNASNNRVLRALKSKSFSFDMAMIVDGGGSAIMKNDGKNIHQGDGRKIHNIITFE